MKRAARACGQTLAFVISTASVAIPPWQVLAGESQAAAPVPASSALGAISARLAADLAAPAKGAVVFVSPLRSDEAAPRGAELAQKLGRIVAGTLGSGATARSELVSLSTAQALARGGKLLLYIELEVSGGQLRATADVYRVTSNVWDRARQPSPVPAAHAFAGARIDAEVRTYLAPLTLSIDRVERVPTEDRDLLAIACGDVDDDGALELVTLGRRRATIGRVRDGKFVPKNVVSLRDLSGIAPAPLREPVVGLAILPARGTSVARVDLGITDRVHGSRLDASLRPVGSIKGVPIATPSGDICATFQGNTLSVAVGACAESDVAPALVPSAPFDTAAIKSLVGPDGTAYTVAASRDPRSGTLNVTSRDRSATIPHAGAQVALADLDQDGWPEIVWSLDVLPNGTPDELVISSWQGLSELRERYRLAVPPGVRAIAACPPESSGAPPVVVATSGELWILR